MPQGLFSAVIFDAGSSGTRPFIYRITPTLVDSNGNVQLGKVVEVVNHNGKSLKASTEETGIQEHRTKEKIEAYLNPLFDDVSGILERLPQTDIPVKYYLYATGGVRDKLNKDEKDELRANLEDYIVNKRKIAEQSFKYDVISGTDEAKYGWVAANRSQARPFDAGYVEMGGATAQIAFPLKPEDHATAEEVVRKMGNRTKLKDVGPQKLFLASYSLGSNAGYEKYLGALFTEEGQRLGLRGEAVNNQTIFFDPSKREGYPQVVSEDKKRIIKFRPNVDQPSAQRNLARTFYLVSYAYKGLFPDHSITDSLLPILRKLEFIGAANFWWSMNDALDAGGAFNLPTFYKCVEDSSKIPHTEYRKKHADKPQHIIEVLDRSIFTAVWTLHVLSQAFGLELKKAWGDTRKEMTFIPYNGGGADRNRFSWTLGVATLLASPDLENLEHSPIRAPAA